jgi:branched-subunit amino acid transport protein
VRFWLSALAVTVATWVMKASGPLALGDRQLPPTAVKVTTLLAPVLLAGLIVVDLGGAGWSEFDWKQVVGVGVAGLARMLKAPMLVAVLCGIATTALLRLLLG